MECSKTLKIFIFFTAWIFIVTTVSSQCDHEKALICINQMEDIIAGLLETTRGEDQSHRLQQLCLDVIKGNNLTRCFIDATNECSESTTEPTSGHQRNSLQRWERVMQDLYGLCDGACPQFLERTVNITQCTGIIRFDALYESSYQTFCQSLNSSLECVTETTDPCPHFGQLFYDLLPNGMRDTASTLCTGGCDNFDNALEHLESCKKYVTDLPDDFDQACTSYEEFKTCVRMSELPVECPMFGSLMEVLYPQHIFGIYDRHCNETGNNEDVCGEIGQARVDHCIRIFAMVWPAGPSKARITKQQCVDFQTGTRCLEKAHFSECPSLREYFSKTIVAREKDKVRMEEKCPELLGGHASKLTTSIWLVLATSVFATKLHRLFPPRF